MTCDGCGVGAGVQTQEFPDGSSYALCEDCRDMAMRMWANFALRHPQQADRVRQEVLEA